jgi:hypothetical protein
MFLVAGKPNRRPVVAAMKVFAAWDRGRVTDGASRVLLIDDPLAAIGLARWCGSPRAKRLPVTRGGRSRLSPDMRGAPGPRTFTGRLGASLP